ncbi:GntR family transcriptional regulator [Saccharothrix sp. NRRL B-16348]|uniref:GntR family transcriptional regulator n=1 Tax=Saccharothrix sp. NRRL B-16348 TaxID=1415542 RepID=UPI0009E7AE0E|nr:winged helix-turn-helix domain-containing protein [Saccharothrix sp. NRRL B-16348]
MDQGAPTSHPYQQVAADIASKIASGALKPGERLKSVRTLAEEYGTTSATVQRALGLLDDEGWVNRVPNVGLFVRDPGDSAGSAPTMRDVMTALDEVQQAVADLRRRVASLEGTGGPEDGRPDR